MEMSCTNTGDDHQLLLLYLRQNNVGRIQDLLKTGKVDVNYVYDFDNTGDEYLFVNKNALQITCGYFANNTNGQCVQILLDNGADVFYQEPDTGKIALHFAAEGGNPKLLKCILQHMSNYNFDWTNCNIIRWLIKQVKDSGDLDEDFVEVLELLLGTEVDVNAVDVDSGWTAIYMAAKFRFRHFVRLIIEMKFDSVNLDSKMPGGKSARDLIVENNLYSGVLPDFKDDTHNVLFENVRNQEVDDFKRNYARFDLSDQEKFDLLRLATDKGLDEVVEFLLSRGVPISPEAKYNILGLASKRGYHKIVKALMRTKPDSEIVSQALIELVKSNLYKRDKDPNINHELCLNELLMSKKTICINYKDDQANTALHYATRYQSSEMSLAILRTGASLACKDSNGKLPIESIDLQTLRAHLNECIQVEHNENVSIGDKEACINLNLTTLLPPRIGTVSNYNVTSCKLELEQKDPLVFSNNQSALLPETEVLQYMCESEQLKPLLTHPVILAFLCLKFHQIRLFFNVNLAVYLVFLASLLTYITVGYNTKHDYEFIAGLSYAFLTLTFVLLILRELAQMFMYKHRYFLAFENWLELVLLVTTGGIVIEQTNETTLRQFSSIAIVAAAFELLLLIGQFPGMSTHIMMLRTVSYTFFKLLLWYSILLFAFAYSFYTLFQVPKSNTPTNATKTEDEDQDFFEHPGMSLLKTIVMLTGEFDASSIKFNTFPVISHLIFVTFVFVIAIVLFNLLNGLAVSDTQIIKNHAKLYEQILRVEHIAHVEKVLLTNKIIYWLPMVKKICLFPTNVLQPCIRVYPNRYSKMVVTGHRDLLDDTEDKKQTCYKSIFDVTLDKKILRDITTLLQDMKEEEQRVKREQFILKEIAELRQALNLNNNK